MEKEMIDRIKEMENHFDNVTKLVNTLDEALSVYEGAKGESLILEEYISSGQWKEDYEADEKGLLPKDIKRGVLSQDGLYDLLENLGEMKNRIEEIILAEKGRA